MSGWVLCQCPNIVCVLTSDTSISSPFLPLSKEEDKKKRSFECLEASVMKHSYLGVIAFKY